MCGSKYKLNGLSGNALKIIAAFSMLVDHIGYLFFPEAELLRIIGRIAFPVFAFMISEGCRYTKNKLRYFLMIFTLAAVCQVVYYFAEGDLYMGILVTFSLSVLVIYAMQNMKNALFSKEDCVKTKTAAVFVFIFAVATVYLLNKYLEIDYGFWGCMAPVFASVLRRTKESNPNFLKKLDCPAANVIMLGAALVILAVQLGDRQWFSLIAILLLLMYSGERGRLKMKYFFYIFYPAHLVILQFINILLN